jgi:hypothetical protein
VKRFYDGTVGHGQLFAAVDRPESKRSAIAKCLPAGSMAEAQRNAILAALVHSGGNMSIAAERLRVGRTSLYRMVGEFGITLPSRQSRRAARKPASRAARVQISLGPAILWTEAGYRWACEA